MPAGRNARGPWNALRNVHANHGDHEWPPSGSPDGGRSLVTRDRYELVRPLGGGAVTRVVEAWDRLARQRVALKVPVRPFAGDEAFLDRLQRSVATAAGIVHPNVAAVHGMEREGRGAFVVVELVDGSSLRDMLADRGPMPAAGAARVAAGACAAVAAAHALGVAHGHLTPANILLTIDGRVKVTDFALAQAAQASAQPPGPAADLRALGRCLGAMLTGREPVDGEPVRLGADVPAELSAIVSRLTGDPHGGESYQSAADAGRDLARFLAAVGADARGTAPQRTGPAQGARAAPDARRSQRAGPAPAAATGLPARRAVAAGSPAHPGSFAGSPARPGASAGLRARRGAAAGSPPGRRTRRLALVGLIAAAVLTGVVAAVGLGGGPGTPASGQAVAPPPTEVPPSTTGRPATTRAPATTVRSRTRPSTTALPSAGRQTTTSAAPTAPDRRVVPDVVGLHREQAADVLARARLEVQVLRVPVQDSGQVQRVVAQQPEAGRLAPAGSQVTLLVGRKRPTG
jgi:eukaryotic-like serine/threonine-protein kinase